MRKYSLWLGFALAMLSPIVANGNQGNPDRPATLGLNGRATIVESSSSRMVVRFDIGNVTTEENVIDGVRYTTVRMDNEGMVGTLGDPEIPILIRNIGIGPNQDVTLRVLSADYRDLQHVRIAPSKGPVPPHTPEEAARLTFGKPYESLDWFPSEVAALKSPFIMRGVHGIPVRVNPVQYRPSDSALRIYTSVVVELTFTDRTGGLVQNVPPARTPNAEFDRLYQRTFLNYDDAIVGGKAVANQAAAFPVPQIIDENGEMLIVVYDGFYDAMLPFVEWKQQRGMKATMVKVSGLYQYQSHRVVQPMSGGNPGPDTVLGACCYGSEFNRQCAVNLKSQCNSLGGTWGPLPWPGWNCGSVSYPCPNSNASVGIKAYLADYYADHTGLSYVLLVGDAQQVSTIMYDFGAGIGTAPSDFSYSLLDGPDLYPDVIVGRFSAESIADVETQVHRTLQYEKTPGTGDWYTKAVGITRPDHIPHMDTIGAYLRSWGVQVDNLYCSDNTCPNSATLSQQLTNALNQGRNIINYCHHGDVYSWGTSSAEIFNTSLILQLLNVGKLPVITSIACLPGRFDPAGPPAFGEAWLRARNAAGDPIGAIGAYMSAIEVIARYLYPCQREINYDLMNGSYTTFGGICYAGALKIIGDPNMPYAKAMNFFGDPSLQVRTANPIAITAEHAAEIAYNAATFTVRVMSGSVPKANAMCVLYSEGNRYGSSPTDTSGYATITLTQPILSSVPLVLTVSGRNTMVLQEPIQVVYNLVIATTPLMDTKNITAPYPILCKVYSGSPLRSLPVLNYKLNGDTNAVSVSMTVTGNPNEYTVSIPAQIAGTTIHYQVTATNQNNNTYSTSWYTFHVIDYAVKLAIPIKKDTEQYQYPIWLDMTITNDGLLDDSYQLAALGAWPATFWDQAGSIQITQTPLLAKDALYHCKLKVLVGSTVAGEIQNTQVIVTSTNKPSLVVSDTVTITSEGQPLPIPFVDSFAATALDTTKWLQAFNMEVRDIASYAVGQGPQPYSAFLYRKLVPIDTTPSSYGIGLESNCIDLHGLSNIFVKYWYERGQQKPPAIGDTLIVKYRDSTGMWHVLCHHLGTGSGDSVFTMNRVNIPAAGLHRRFKLRFENVSSASPRGTQQVDYWFIDNISVYVGIPNAPQLISPAANTNSTNITPALIWHPSPYAVRYEVLIDDNIDFSSPWGSAVVTDTSWTVTPALVTGTYYWKVRAQVEDPDWSPSSATWTYVRTEPGHPNPSCPVLFAHDGSTFQQENPLLTACELTNYTQKVTDYYQVKTPVVAREGAVTFELRELEDEVTYLDNIELIAVDHSVQSKVGCTVDGTIFAYESSVPPISAIDQDGGDWTTQLTAKDDKYFHADKPGYLLVTFPAPTGKASYSLTSALKQICYVDAKADPERGPYSRPPTSGIEVSDNIAGGSWRTYPALSPRTNPTTEFLEVRNASGGTGTNLLKVSWPGSYTADAISMVAYADEAPVVSRFAASKAELRLSQPEQRFACRIPSSSPLILHKGDVLSLVFETGVAPATPQARDFIVKATGRYEPLQKSDVVVPDRFSLFDNYPNPFNPTTAISFNLPTASEYTLVIYNVTGQVVQQFAGSSEAGHVVLTWDATGMASGVYLYRLTAGPFTDTKKMVLLK